jgi:hypothetical protein
MALQIRARYRYSTKAWGWDDHLYHGFGLWLAQERGLAQLGDFNRAQVYLPLESLDLVLAISVS